MGYRQYTWRWGQYTLDYRYSLTLRRHHAQKLSDEKDAQAATQTDAKGPGADNGAYDGEGPGAFYQDGTGNPGAGKKREGPNGCNDGSEQEVSHRPGATDAINSTYFPFYCIMCSWY